MIEHYFDCPHCWENQLKMIDPSIEEQNFIEDCEVCCNFDYPERGTQSDGKGDGGALLVGVDLKVTAVVRSACASPQPVPGPHVLPQPVS